MSKVKGNIAMTSAWLIVMIVALVTSLMFPPRTRLFPVFVSSVAVALCLIQLATDVRHAVQLSEQDHSRVLDLEGAVDLSAQEIYRRLGGFVAWIVGYTVLVWLIGFIPTSGIYLIAYLTSMTEASRLTVFIYVVSATALLLAVFHYALRLPWPEGIIPGPQNFVLDLLK